MGERRQRPEHAGVADECVELAPALEERGAEPVERVEIGEVAGNERRFAAQRANLVVEFFKRALGARERDDMRAASGELQRQRAADAARRAGDESDAGGGGREAWLRGHSNS